MTPVRFFLVRHAKAETKQVADSARRLTPEGRARFAAHAEAIARDLPLARILTSPYARARETAELLSRATGAPVEEEAALASGASPPADVLALGRARGPDVALVGHNPELAAAIALAAGRDLDVPPGTVAAIDADGAGFRLVWLRAPA